MDDLVLDAEGSDSEPTADIKELGPCTKTITITVPAAAVDDRLENSYSTLSAQAVLPGFRKGHIPRQIIEKRFGTSMREETHGQLLSDAYAKVVQANDLNVLGDPEFKNDHSDSTVEAGKDLVFTVEIEVVPDFELPNLEGVPVIKPEMEILDSHIDDEITRSRYRLGKPETIKGPFQHLDRMSGRVEVHLDDSEDIFFEHDDVVGVVPAEDDEGRGQFLGLIVEGLDKILIGKKVGDSVDFETKGPDSHEREELRGAKVKIHFDIRSAERVTALEVQELVEAFGLDNEAGLKEQLRISLERKRDADQRTAEREQVHEWLLENIKFEVPPRLSESQVTRVIESQRMELASQGLDNDEIETRLAQMRTKGEASTQDQLRLFFIFGRLSNHFELKVSEEEINGKISELALSRGMRPDQVRAELAKANRIRDIAMQIQQHKAADRIVDTAKVTSMPAEEWNSRFEKKDGTTSEKKDSSSKKSTTKKSSAKKSSTKKSSAKKTTKKSAKKKSGDTKG